MCDDDIPAYRQAPDQPGVEQLLRNLMARIGHSSTRAAMVYQHATRDRDDAVAADLDELIEEARSKIE